MVETTIIETTVIETTVIQSKSLHSQVTVRTVLPGNGPAQKIFILLHGNIQPEGAFSMLESLPEELALEELCEKYHLIVAIPYMKNCYYISTEQYDCNQFIAEELPEWLCDTYFLPHETERILGGISMGGYGAALIGAHTSAFTKIITISGAYIVEDILIGNPEVWGERVPTEESTEGTYLYYFLPLDELLHSMDKNVIAALSLFSQRTTKPLFVVTCGTEDWLYPRNLSFVNKLEELKIPYDLIPVDAGGHDNVCFKEGLWKAIDNTFCS